MENEDILPIGIKIVSVYDLQKELVTLHGKKAGQDFLSLVNKKEPEQPAILEAFLKDKDDLVSIECMKALEKQKEMRHNAN